MTFSPITRVQFQEFRDLQQKRRWDWPATFSVNCNGDIWPCVRNGVTPVNERIDVKEFSPILKWVAEVYTAIRPEGGRFFIGDDGGFWKSKVPQPDGISWRNLGRTFAEDARRRAGELNDISHLLIQLG
jgi:hypothetical protein